MKHTLRCPKCDGRKLWRIEKFRHQSDVLGGTELCVAITNRDKLWGGHTPTGAFDLYACAGCGYSELWARDIERMKPKPDEGVHLIDGTAAKDKPYR